MTYGKEITQLHQNFISFYTLNGTKEEKTKKYLSEISEQGSWADINYLSKRRGDWDTRKHLDRLIEMATSYVHPNSKLYKDKKLQQAVLAGQRYWVKHDFQNPNWYNARIGVPQRLSISFLLMGADLPQELINESLKTVLNRTEIGMTGQNKVWCSEIVIMRGMLSSDEELIRKGRASVLEELRCSTEEGIQPDGTFHQHGPQFQSGVYGLSFLDSMVRWSVIFGDSEFAFPDEKLAILKNYLFDGSAWFLWNGALDLNACGRQIGPNCQQSKGKVISKQLELIQKTNEVQNSTNKSNLLTGFKAFWRSDIAIYRTENWMASLKMSSSRTLGCEDCNSENIQGLHQADGTLLVYQDTKEYKDIQPLWNWNRLPGTTCDQDLESIAPHKGNKNFGGTAFAGSMKVKEGGVASLYYKRNNLEAKKAWFFTPDFILCLGAGISGESKGKVLTSIEQTWQQSSVIRDDKLFYHNNRSYQILQGKVGCNQEHVKDNWLKLFPTRPDAPAEGDVFSLWIDHGKSPQNEKYAYIVFPNSTDPKNNHNKLNYQLLKNSSSVQAFQYSETVQSVFYEAGKLDTKEYHIEVSEPCLFAFNGTELVVSDPSHKLSHLSVKINGIRHEVTLPEGEAKGKQVKVNTL